MNSQRVLKFTWGVLALAAALISAEAIPATGQPKIKYKETSWDFGRVKQGELLSHEFIFSNEGDATLIIQKVTTTCGCTAALLSAEKVPPGREGKIEVKFDTRGYGGQVNKLLFVDSNDPNQARQQLQVTADIETPPAPRIELDPYNYDAGLVVENEGIVANLKVMNKGELELKVEFNHRSATYASGGRPVSLPLKIAAGKEVTVEVRIPTQDRTGVVREYLLIKSNDPMRTTLSLYITGYIVSKEKLRELFERYKDILR
jgi:ribosomal protein L30E